jgi:hypothetical protein
LEDSPARVVAAVVEVATAAKRHVPALLLSPPLS